MRCLCPEAGPIEHCLFSEIMPALERGQAPYGVVIHEGRFVYRERGLHLVQDLGQAWEAATGGPVPLGGLLAGLDLPEGVARRLGELVRRSIDYAWAHKDEAFETMRRHAQELSPEAVWSHVDLYVNAQTRDLGEIGARTLDMLDARARAAGLIPPGAPRLRILA
jgi:1,4-dihydroxy-6-naphthoate synthase